MAVFRKKQRAGGEIPTSSMADIAFLLLVFFLVTTVFDEEKGLQVVLPEAQVEQEVSQKNVYHFLIQPDGSVVVRMGEAQQESRMRAADVGSLWAQGYQSNPNLIAAVKTHPDASYKFMVDVLDALHAAGAERISLQLLEN